MQDLIDKLQAMIAEGIQPELERLEREKKALLDAIKALRGK